MSSSTYPGNPDCAPTGFCPAPPPPPPPPPAPGQVPSLRISTAEAPVPRRARPDNSNDPYEPPAAIQNAMMTKDKKPFTYTPGMGGKLDLSQIRSPRMARRVAKNANDEGIEGPPKSALESKTSPPIPGGNVYVQPQVAVPVFPTAMPVLPQPPIRAPNSQLNRVASNVADRAVELPRQAPNPAATSVVVTPVQPTSPTSPGTPPVTLTKAPTPWLQNKNKNQEELPEWAKRTNASRSDDSLPESPVSPGTPRQIQPIQLIQQTQPTQPTQQQQQQQIRPQTQQMERTIPLRIEDRPSVFSVKHEPGHHQLKQSTPHHQQRWSQQQGPSQGPSQVPIQIQQQRPDGARVIPIMVEDNSPRSPARSMPSPAFVQSQGPAQIRNIPVDNQASRVDVQRGPMPGQQYEPGPLQSRAFRVLQKITDTDSDIDTDPASEQIRKLQLTEDDRTLMNKFKEQVDGDTYLHQEEDPRYRGAAIPSRAFRFLQSMTDSGEVPAASSGPRAPTAIQKKQQNRNSKSFEEAQANLPPSEQQVQEPKKYMGSAIPSRSFRILQAMTSPESVATQENRQPDFACQTENNMPGNQQGVFFSNCPSPYWNPEGGWWGYYPMQYAPNTNSNNVPYDSYAYYGYGDGNAYAYYPMYDQNYAAQGYVDQTKSGNRIETDYSDAGYAQIYPQYATTANCDHNYNCCYGQTEDTAIYNSVYPSPGEELVLTSQKESSVPKENPDLLTVPKWTSPSNTMVSINDTSSGSRDTIRTNSSTSPSITDEDVEATKMMSLKKLNNGDRYNGKIQSTERMDNEDANSSDEDSSDDNTSSDSTSSSSDTDSDSDSDSDSGSEYLAYSTGLNPRERIEHQEEVTDVKVNLVEKESGQSLSATTISDDTYEHSSRLSSDKMSCSEIDSDVDDDYQIESLNNDSIFPHQLSVIYEDVEHTDAEHRGLEVRKDPQEKKDVPLEETDDPPDDIDDNDTTTVSVSLPLRFKFSVSENDEEVTTVTVGNSLVKSEKSSSKEETVTRSCTKVNDEDNDIHVNFQINKNSDATANFTLKKQKSGETFDTELTLGTEEIEAQLELKETGKKMLNADITNVNDVDECISADCEYTFKKDKESSVEKVDFNDNVETEFTVRTKKTDVTKHIWAKDLSLANETDLETRTSNESTASDIVTECKTKILTTNGHDTNNCQEEFLVTESKSELDGDLCKEIIETKSLKIKESESVETEFTVAKLHPGNAKKDEVDRVEQRNDHIKCPTSTDQDNERNIIDDHGLSEMLAFELTIQNGEKEYGGSDGTHFSYKGTKHLLSVQNSRDETDDEDSGVTSDMSRLISEVDTDSECAPNKKSSKYQRTQTHSRLFKLLNDDSILAEDSSEESGTPASRDHLSLPLKRNVFNYDDNYYSNYSSGLTSPEYSPVCEQSWRRLHEMDSSTDYEESARLALRQGTITDADSPNQKDPYFQTWKSPNSPSEFDYDILPSLTFKKLENRTVPFRIQKINVLCPRIRSSKNVPQALQSARAKPIVSSIPSPCYLKNDRC